MNYQRCCELLKNLYEQQSDLFVETLSEDEQDTLQNNLNGGSLFSVKGISSALKYGSSAVEAFGGAVARIKQWDNLTGEQQKRLVDFCEQIRESEPSEGLGAFVADNIMVGVHNPVFYTEAVNGDSLLQLNSDVSLDMNTVGGAALGGGAGYALTRFVPIAKTLPLWGKAAATVLPGLYGTVRGIKHSYYEKGTYNATPGQELLERVKNQLDSTGRQPAAGENESAKTEKKEEEKTEENKEENKENKEENKKNENPDKDNQIEKIAGPASSPLTAAPKPEQNTVKTTRVKAPAKNTQKPEKTPVRNIPSNPAVPQKGSVPQIPAIDTPTTAAVAQAQEESWWSRYKTWILGIGGALLIGIGGYFIFRKQKKKTSKAKNEVARLQSEVGNLNTQISKLKETLSATSNQPGNTNTPNTDAGSNSATPNTGTGSTGIPNTGAGSNTEIPGTNSEPNTGATPNTGTGSTSIPNTGAGSNTEIPGTNSEPNTGATPNTGTGSTSIPNTGEDSNTSSGTNTQTSPKTVIGSPVNEDVRYKEVLIHSKAGENQA